MHDDATEHDATYAYRNSRNEPSGRYVLRNVTVSLFDADVIPKNSKKGEGYVGKQETNNWTQ